MSRFTVFTTPPFIGTGTQSLPQLPDPFELVGLFIPSVSNATGGGAAVILTVATNNGTTVSRKITGNATVPAATTRAVAFAQSASDSDNSVASVLSIPLPTELIIGPGDRVTLSVLPASASVSVTGETVWTIRRLPLPGRKPRHDD